MYGTSQEREPSKQYLYRVFRLSYKPRRFNHKGALLTLLWNFSVFLVICYFLKLRSDESYNFHVSYVFGASIVTYPIAGWLADVYFGRFKVMSLGMFIMWVATILYMVLRLIEDFLPHDAVRVIILSLLVIGVLALGGYQANSIQFGIDQLIDAPSSAISSYISWYIWLYFLCDLVVTFLHMCVCDKYITVFTLLLPTALTLSLGANMLFNHWLLKEPVSFNPLKLIFRVSRFAIQNKYPIRRSALDYWDDKCHSRIDFAKLNFGGPFTSEQVEDVKMFFKILVILLAGSTFVGLAIIVQNTGNNMIYHYQDQNFYPVGNSCFTRNVTKNCIERAIVSSVSSLIMVVLIPTFEIIIFPVLWKCLPRVGISGRFLVGMVLEFLYQVSLLLFEVIGHYVMSRDHSLTSNVICLLVSTYKDVQLHNTLSVNFKWLALTEVFRGVSVYLLSTSTIEFVCAQTPYSMKGLVSGLIYCLSGFSIIVAACIRLPFRIVKVECGVWYYMTVSLLSGVMTVVACVVVKWYSKRKRNQSINENIFTVGSPSSWSA